MMDAEDKGTMEIVKTSEALEAVTRGEIDIQIATAKKWPRVMSQFREKVIEYATIDQDTAESCWYALPRGGKVIEGPSARMAEIVAASYKNLRIASRVVGTDERYVTCQGACHDLENNIAASVEVKRRITKKPRQGQMIGDRFDEDMIVVTANAACSIAFRNAIFKVVPAALLKSAFADIKKVAMGDERTLGERRKAIFVYFKNKGVTEDRVLAVVNRRGPEDLTLEDVATLRGLATALSEGATTVEEAFPAASNSGKLAAGRRSTKKARAAADAKGGGAGSQSVENTMPRAETQGPEQAPSDGEQSEPAAHSAVEEPEPFDRESAEGEIAAYAKTAKDLTSFDDACERLDKDRETWKECGDSAINKLLGTVRDLVAARE